eukprot:scaffold14931_cov197-Amphora_coffeaeformis.AAC.1
MPVARKHRALLPITIGSALSSLASGLAPSNFLILGGRIATQPSAPLLQSIRPLNSLVPSSRLFSSSIPEPGPCPECKDETTYWDGSTLFVCTNCGHEWPATGTAAEYNSEGSDDTAIRDVNGKILQQGDACVLTQDLAKGKLKKGLKVKIRLGDYGDGHDCEATIEGVGTYALKSKFLKKV